MITEKEMENKTRGGRTEWQGEAGAKTQTKYSARGCGEHGFSRTWSSGGAGAFTLVEVMVTVVVIGVIAGIVLAAAGGVQKKAARDQTKAEIKMICVALESFKANHGAYPAMSGNFSTNFYASLTNFLSWKTNQIRGIGTNQAILDPYGNAYRYRSPAVSSTTMLDDSFEVWSAGPNGRSDYDSGLKNAGANSLDDLTSWQ